MTTVHSLRNAARTARRDVERVSEAMLTAPGEVARECGTWTLLELSRDGPGTKTLKALIPEEGKPLAEIRQNPDRTLSFTLWGKPRNGGKIELEPRELSGQFVHWASRKIAKQVRKKAGPAFMRDMATGHPQRRKEDRPAALEDAARMLMELITAPGNRGPAEVWDLEPAISETVLEELIDPWARRTYLDWYRRHRTPNGERTLDIHNSLALNQDVFARMMREAPNPLRYYLRYVLDEGERPRKFRHPGQVVTLAREHSGLEPAAWRQLCRIPLPVRESDSGWNGPPEWLLAGCRAAAAANRPEARRGPLRAVMEMGHRHLMFQDLRWEHGDPWAAWVQVLNQFLAPGDREASRNRTELHAVADALESHILDGHPWGPGSWRNLTVRSARWHLQLLQAANRDLYQRARGVSWESPAGQTQWREFTLRPVCEGTSLVTLGDRMGNCLGSYWQSCARGERLIFTISQGEELRAAAELVRATDGWRLGQLEAPRRGRLDPAVREAAQELPRLCNQAVASGQSSVIGEEYGRGTAERPGNKIPGGRDRHQRDGHPPGDPQEPPGAGRGRRHHGAGTRGGGKQRDAPHHRGLRAPGG